MSAEWGPHRGEAGGARWPHGGSGVPWPGTYPQHPGPEAPPARAVTAPPAPPAGPVPAESAFAPPAGHAWSRVSPRLCWFRRILVLVAGGAALGIGTFLAARQWGPVGGLLAVMMVLGGCVLGWSAAELDYRSWGYAERADDLVLTHGVLFRKLVVIPYGRMQAVDVTASVLEQWFGIATVRVYTAAATTDARIPGLPTPEATRLRDRLAQRGEQRSAGL